MSELLTVVPWLLAADAAPGGGSGSILFYFLPIPFLLYFLMIRPQRQQDKQRKEMLVALKKNDKVLTAAGIYGTVVSVVPEKDQVLVRVDDDRGTRIAFTTASIVRVLAEPSEKAATA